MLIQHFCVTDKRFPPRTVFKYDEHLANGLNYQNIQSYQIHSVY